MCLLSYVISANIPGMPTSRYRTCPDNPYHVLGVPPDASQRAIKRAFRKRALECHPDRAAAGEEAASTEEFVRVREAFDVLSDPASRRRYDERRAARRRRSRRRAHPPNGAAPSASNGRSSSRWRRAQRKGREHADRRARRYARRREGGRFARAWRNEETPNVWVGPMSERINGLSRKHDLLHQHHRTVVPAGGILGAVVFLSNPTIIHTTGSLLVDLALCVFISAACGFAVSMLVGVAHMLFQERRAA